MTSQFEAAFAHYYRGRHHPEDALWWLTHPTEPGPSSAPPPQAAFLSALHALNPTDDYPLAAALLGAALELLRADLRHTIDALQQAQRIIDGASAGEPRERGTSGCGVDAT